MQIQIINLLKVVTFKLNKCLGEMIEQDRLVLRQNLISGLFFPNLLKGLLVGQKFYVRERFIDLISFSIYMLSESICQIDENKLNDSIKEIVTQFLKILENVDFQEEEILEE
jgi:hypothetical protein